jgi:hypothetical protein
MTQVIDMPNPKGNEASLKKFKPKWYNGTTQTIRVPIALTDQILDYAHKLDESPSQVNETDSNSHAIVTERDKLLEALTQVIETLEYIHIVDRYTKSVRSKLQERAITPLKALIQVIEVPPEDSNPVVTDSDSYTDTSE